ncbi:MAG: two-component system, OmpR family, alkaline phosphatase synthesis response regulator PhoP [Bacteroidetes bacterium]|nr:MAG: two-component system, OmpR family, alkaline phosphatase synthesis response regulator PhoP [Bacteroidota bacterium]
MSKLHAMISEKRKVLIVDDEPDIREFIGYNLIRKGYTVHTAGDGQAGYNLAVENKPDLIILDILMPVMNGYETCQKLRQNPLFANTPIIFLSALHQSYVQTLGIKLQADGFINKPVRIELLIQRVEEWLENAS